MGRRSNQQCDLSTMEDDRWTVDSGQTRSSSGPFSTPSVAVRGCTSTEGENHQARHQRVRRHDWMPRLQCDWRQQKSTSTLRSLQKMRIEERLRTTSHRAERLDRRADVMNEALAEEVRREEQKRRRSDRKAAEVTEAASSAPAALGPRESPIEPDPNPKRRLIMKSASTTASGSRQEGGRRVISDDDSRMQIEAKPEVEKRRRAEPPGAPSTSTRRRIAVMS